MMKNMIKLIAPLFIVALFVVGSFSAAYAVYDAGFSGSLGEIEIVGTVDEVTDDAYIIDGVTYLVTTTTEIEGLIESGALVEVHLYTDADGNLTIREIELADSDDLSDDHSGMDDDDDMIDDDEMDDDSYNDGDDDGNSDGDDDDSNHDNDDDSEDDSDDDDDDDDSDEDDDDDDGDDD